MRPQAEAFGQVPSHTFRLRTAALEKEKMQCIIIISGLCLLLALLVLLMVIAQSWLIIMPTLATWAQQVLLMILVLPGITFAAAGLMAHINVLMKRIESSEANHAQLIQQMKRVIPWFFTVVLLLASTSMFIVDKTFPGERANWDVIIVGITLIILFGFASILIASEKTQWLGMLIWYAAVFLPPALIFQTHSVPHVSGNPKRLRPTLIVCLVCSLLVTLTAPFFQRTATR